MLWNLAVLRAMVALAMLDDGQLKQSEIDRIREAFFSVSDDPVSQDVIAEIAQKLDHCSSPGDDVEAELRPFAKIVPHTKKLKAMEGLRKVAYADGGELRDDERKLIDRAASALWVSGVDVDRAAAESRGKWYLAVFRAMVALAMVDDGRMKQSEIDSIRAITTRITNDLVSEDAIVKFAKKLDDDSSSPIDVEAELRPFAKLVSHGDKIQAVKGLCLVAYADGELHDDERKLIDVAASALEVGRLEVDRELSVVREKVQAARVVVAAVEAEKKQSKSPSPPPIRNAPARAIAGEAQGAATEAEKQKSLLQPPIPDALAKAISEEAAALSLETLMTSIDDYRRGQWDQRASYVQAAVDHWADKAVTKGCPNSAAGDLFRGVLMIDRAWEARGGSGMASPVPRQQARAYLLCLEMAREALLRSAERDPEDPTPYAFLAGPVAAGLQVGQDQAREWFLAAVKRDPFNYVAHAGRLQTLSLKWGGSHAAMHEFAEETVQKAPHDSLLRTIRYQALYEQWFFHQSIVGDTTSAKNYLSDVDVQKETLAIFRQVLEKNSVQDIFQCVVHMNATKWLISCGQDEAANTELNKLRPWHRLLDEDLRNKQERVVDGEHANNAGSNENAPASTEAGIIAVNYSIEETNHQLVRNSSSQRRGSF